MANLKVIDPVKGLTDYILDIKPYHTKIVEVLFKFVLEDSIFTGFIDNIGIDTTLMYPQGRYENGKLIEGSLLDPNAEFRYEYTTGWDTAGYDNIVLSISSPNPALSFIDYPAISSSSTGQNNFIIPGDVGSAFIVGDVIQLESRMTNRSDAQPLQGIDNTSSPNAFRVSGDVRSQFVVGYTFIAERAGINDGTYTVHSFDSSHDPLSDITTIPVAEPIPADYTGGVIGVQANPGIHTGNFEVTNIEFKEGTIDYLTNPVDFSTFMLGDRPYTTITVLEPLANIPSVPPQSFYTVDVIPHPTDIELAVSYSRAETILTPVYIQQPNEGLNRREIVEVSLSTIVGGSPVPDTGKFTVVDDFRSSNVEVGDDFRVDASPANNGLYTITSITFDGIDRTTFGVAELVDSPIIDGFGTIHIPSNVFFVDGDRRTEFVAGKQFNIVNGPFANLLTILRSDFSAGKTRVRAAESIFDRNKGNIIVSSSPAFVIEGDFTVEYVAGVNFTVIDSPENNGQYVVSVNSIYDPVLDLTTVPVVDTLSSLPGGKLYSIPSLVYGSFTPQLYGWDENSPLSEFVPDIIAASYILDEMTRTWGGSVNRNIVGVNDTADTIDIVGDYTSGVDAIQVNNALSIIDSEGIDGSYRVSAISSASNITTIELDNPPLTYQPVIPFTIVEPILQSHRIDFTNPDNKIEIKGNGGKHFDYLPVGKSFNITGSTHNDGVFTVSSTIYNAHNDLLTIITNEVINLIDQDNGEVEGVIDYEQIRYGQAVMEEIGIQYWVTELDNVLSEISIAGQVMDDIAIGKLLTLVGTYSNDGVFTINNVAPYDSTADITIVTVDELISLGTMPDNIVSYPDNTTIEILHTNAAKSFKLGDNIEISGSTGANNGTHNVIGAEVIIIREPPVPPETEPGRIIAKNSLLTVDTPFPDSITDGDASFTERGVWAETRKYR